jgi:HAD superfamily hydrolase (TIGR01509 family)
VKVQIMQIQGVLFDLFNTLVLLENDDVFYMPSLRKSYDYLVKNEINVPFEEFVRVYFEVRDKLYEETSQTLEDPHFNIRISRTLQSLGYKLDASHPTIAGAGEAFCKEFLKYTRLDEDALFVLQQLKGKFKLGIVSNLSIPECVPELLKKFNLDDYFDVVVISGAINKRKPSPEIFKKALETLGLKPHDAVFVGDTPGIDIKGARAVGLKTILIERPPPPKGSFSLTYEIPGAHEKAQPDKVIKSLREILPIVEDC